LEKKELNIKPKKGLSFKEKIESLRGSISKESAEEFNLYVKKSREEWGEREQKQFNN
jgi:hypothetical protein